MAELFGQQSMSGASSVPPPPPVEGSGGAMAEVTIRTMAGDLMMLGQTGGFAPTGERVAVSMPEMSYAKPNTAVVGAAASTSTGKNNLMLWLAIGGVGLLVLFLVSYYVFSNISPPDAAPTSRAPSASGAPGLPAPTTGPIFFGHESFFRSATEGRVSVTLAPGASDSVRARFQDDLRAGRALVAPEAKFLEVELLKNDGRPPAWTEFLIALDAPLLSDDSFTEAFTRDFTAFIYADGQMLWPGYILKLKDGLSPLSVRSAIAAYEGNSAYKNLFLDDPGQTSGPFRDALVSGQSVRMATFTSGTASFVSGWFYGKYFILSTSPDGVREALARL